MKNDGNGTKLYGSAFRYCSFTVIKFNDYKIIKDH